MNIKRLVALSSVALAVALTPSASSADTARDARHACKQSARAELGARSFDDVTAAKTGGGRFQVTGTMSARDGKRSTFRCRYESGRVVSVTSDSSSDGVGRAVGALIGVAVGAAILGALSKDHEHDGHQGGGSDTDSGNDQRYQPEGNPGFWCYPRQRACYRPNGNFAPRVTQREFRHAAQQPEKPGVTEREMPAFCRGEASQRFHVRPQDITTLPVEREGARYVVYGQHPTRGGRTAFFTCRFTADGQLASVQRD